MICYYKHNNLKLGQSVEILEMHIFIAFCTLFFQTQNRNKIIIFFSLRHKLWSQTFFLFVYTIFNSINISNAKDILCMENQFLAQMNSNSNKCYIEVDSCRKKNPSQELIDDIYFVLDRTRTATMMTTTILRTNQLTHAKCCSMLFILEVRIV